MGYFDEALEHSAGAWKKHKYIRKDGKKYIYKETQENEDGAVWDKYQNEDTGETIKVNRTFKYDPDRYSTKDFADDTIGEEAEEKLASAFKKKDKDKYLVKHSDDYLEHHGILGQKWGVRRFQNADGSLTAEGKRRVYAQGADGGYESFRHRHKRAIEGAKYERDIQKNQKKLDRAYEKGNEKKIAKYTQADKILRTNRDIMVKDLSPEAIQMGRDYIKMMRATGIGVILAGPVGGVVAGTASRAINKMADNEKKVYAQEREREVNYKVNEQLAKEKASREKNFDKYVDEHGGKLTTENLPSHDREGYPTYMLTEKQKQKYVDEYNKKRNSFGSDEDKDLWEAQQNATSKKEKDKIIDDRVKLAKKTNQYEMEFLERNLDVDDETGEQLKGKAMDDAYRKYLQEEKNYYR